MRQARLRAGGVDDVPAVMRVMDDAFDPRFGEAWNEAQCFAMIAATGCSLTIAEDGEMLGFALSRTIIDTCELMLIAVSSDRRRNGVGRQLLDAIISDARANGAAALFLEMRETNPAARLYASRGFIQIGRRKNYYRGAFGEVIDAVTYQLRLS